MVIAEKGDEPTLIPADKAHTSTSDQGLRLARIGPVLTLALVSSILLGAGLFTGALWLLDFPAIAPIVQQGASSRLLDLLKLSFAVVAGIGGVIALIVAYRKLQKDGVPLILETFW